MYAMGEKKKNTEQTTYGGCTGHANVKWLPVLCREIKWQEHKKMCRGYFNKLLLTEIRGLLNDF